jgi:Tfp pilus assembly PilM family ATPase
MTTSGDEHLFGLNIVGRRLKGVEAEQHLDQIGIKAVAETTLTVPFDLNVVKHEEVVAQYADAINKLLEEKSIRATTARFALDRRLILMKTVQLDRGLSDRQIQDQIEWETEQLLIAPRKEFNVGVESLGSHYGQQDVYLITAVRKQVISFLRDVFVRTPLTLSVIDVDVLAAVRGLQGKSKRRPETLAALVDFNDFGIDFTLVREGRFLCSSEISSVKEGEGENNSKQVAKVISDELSHLLESVKDDLLPASYDSIYLSGDNAEVEIIPHLQGMQKTADIRFADPFSSFNLFFEAESDPLIKNKPEKFIVTAGMVITLED